MELNSFLHKKKQKETVDHLPIKELTILNLQTFIFSFAAASLIVKKHTF